MIRDGKSKESIENLEDLNKEIELVSSRIGFMGQGFTAESNSEGSKVNLKKIFEDNKYIDTTKGVHAFGCSTQANGLSGTTTKRYSPINEVEQLYKEITGETKTMYGLYNGSLKLSTKTLRKCTDLFAMGQSYWLGGASYSEDSLWCVGDSGGVSTTDGNYRNGVRPVVSLRSGVEITGSGLNKGISSDTAYQLK